MLARQPLPLLLTAEGFLAKYGPHDEYDYFRHLSQLTSPTLILLGTESVRHSPAFAGQPEEMVEVLHSQPDMPLRFELVEGADTIYSTCLEEPYRRTEHWLRSLAK